MRNSLLCRPTPSHVILVLVHAVPEWLVDDGVRSLKDPVHFTDYFRNTLEDMAIPYIEINSDVRDIKARVEFVKGALKTR